MTNDIIDNVICHVSVTSNILIKVLNIGGTIQSCDQSIYIAPFVITLT